MFKKLSPLTKISALILFALAYFGPKPAHAWIFQEVPDKTVTVRYRIAVAANISTSSVVIDLSGSTTTWPHAESGNGQLNISSIRVQIDKVAASTCTVKLGVVNFVDSSTGSVTWFYPVEVGLNVSNTVVKDYENYSPNYLRLKVNPAGPTSNGLTPYLLSSDVTSGSAEFQTDVSLPCASGTMTAPGVGDIVATIVNGGGAIVVNFEIQYHAASR